MDRHKAADLIKKHRYWMSSETDYAVARRAEHAYTHCAVAMSYLAIVSIMLDVSLWFRFVPSLLLLTFAGFCYWRSQQFVKIRQMFEDRWPQNFSDLDNKTDSGLPT